MILQQAIKELLLQTKEKLARGEEHSLQSYLSSLVQEYGQDVESVQSITPELQKLHNHLHRLDFLFECFQKHHPEEIIIHSAEDVQLISPNLKLSLEMEQEAFELALLILAQREGQTWNTSSPFASFFLDMNGVKFRVTLLHKSTGPYSFSKASFRPMAKKRFTLSDFEVPPIAQEKIEDAVKTKRNILVVGATGSGKTAFLKSLFAYIPKDEHIIAIEDTHELLVPEHRMTYLLAQEQEEKSMKSYCSYAMRLRPDRMILGELRGGETVPFLLGLNTGHGGMMSTIHANSAQDTIKRLVLLFNLYSDSNAISHETLTDFFCQDLDFIIFLENKKLKGLLRVISSENGHPYFENALL